MVTKKPVNGDVCNLQNTSCSMLSEISLAQILEYHKQVNQFMTSKVKQIETVNQMIKRPKLELKIEGFKIR